MSKPISYDAFCAYDRHYRRMMNDLPSKQIFLDSLGVDGQKPWMAEVSEEAKIIDIGCGYGHQLYILHHLGFKNLYGIEIAEHSLKIALQELGDFADIQKIDAFNFLPRNHDSFDVIILNDVLEHIPSSRTIELLRLINGALKPGGIVSIRVPNMASLLSSYSMYLDFTHLVGFTEFSLMQVLDLSGFKEHKILNNKPKFYFSIKNPKRSVRRLLSIWRYFVNDLLHKVLYLLRWQKPMPTVFDFNVEVYSKKPLIDYRSL